MKATNFERLSNKTYKVSFDDLSYKIFRGFTKKELIAFLAKIKLL